MVSLWRWGLKSEVNSEYYTTPTDRAWWLIMQRIYTHKNIFTNTKNGCIKLIKNSKNDHYRNELISESCSMFLTLWQTKISLVDTYKHEIYNENFFSVIDGSWNKEEFSKIRNLLSGFSVWEGLVTSWVVCEDRFILEKEKIWGITETSPRKNPDLKTLCILPNDNINRTWQYRIDSRGGGRLSERPSLEIFNMSGG